MEGSDLVVDGSHVFMRTTSGLQRVDSIYRRLDDDYLDPLVFRRDSTLGVPGIINAYRAGNVALCNAPGAGVADDKAVYAYMPALTRFYLDEDPILAQIPTYVGARPDDFAYMVDHLGCVGGQDDRGCRGLWNVDGAVLHSRRDRFVPCEDA